MMGTRVRINVGSGQALIKGWRNFDNSLSVLLAHIPLLPKLLYQFNLLDTSRYQFVQFAQSHQIEYGDATKTLPVSSGSVDVLYSCHMLEHLNQAEASAFLKEARRVLRSGGIIRLVVPDLRWGVQHYIQSGDADGYIGGLLESRPKSITERLRFLLVGSRYHQWMYDGNSLCRLLLEHGFVNPTSMQPGETRIQDPEPLNLEERSPGSVYAEAENP